MLKNNINNILTYIFSLVICVCLILIAKDVLNYKRATKEYNRLEEYMVEADPKSGGINEISDLEEPFIESKNVSYYDKLYEINHDLVGVLSIPTLGLKYPVVQCGDNEKYLSTTFEGNSNPAGCLFIDYENSNDFTDPNTYIYGHNMKDGSMFGSLKKIVREGMEPSQVEAYVTTSEGEISYILEEAKVVNIDEYKPAETGEGLLTLYTCWGNDKEKRLLVTFEKAEDKV